MTRMALTPGPAMPVCACEKPSGLEKCIIAAFLIAVAGFGALVEVRSAFLSNRKTDAGVYFRAGWAVRTGADLYRISDDNGWHYAYPPAFAVVMAPLADAPGSQPRPWMLPYPVSVAIWYVLGVIVVFLAVHWTALALEESGAIPSLPGSRRWVVTRMLPVMICLCPIGTTLQRGQVNMAVVAIVARMFLETVRGRRFYSGCWLAAAICMKIFPAFLVLFPLWRRDRRALAGTTFGLLVGFVVVPSLVWGFAGALDVHEKMFDTVIKPGLGLSSSATLAQEMLEMTATDNQSIQAIVHNYKHWDRSARPHLASWGTKLTHVITGLLLTVGLLLAFGWKRDNNPVRMLLFLGGLVTIMAVTSPVSHTHYFCLAMPAVMGLSAHSILQDPRRLYPRASLLVLLIGLGCLFTLPSVPIWEGRREAGLSLLACLILWMMIVIVLACGRKIECASRPSRSLAQAA
jgi:alpha-1,2-mannosyltransferase